MRHGLNRSERGSEASTAAQVHAKAEQSEGFGLKRSEHGSGATAGAQVHTRVERSSGRSLRVQTFALVVCGLVFAGLPAQADAPSSQYTINSGTVLDNLTHLTWQQMPPAVGPDGRDGGFFWNNATSYCSSLMLNGMGWRLPTATELASIVDVSKTFPAIDTTVFPGVGTAYVFWSATPLATQNTFAWFVDFSDGTVHPGSTTFAYRVRCVR